MACLLSPGIIQNHTEPHFIGKVKDMVLEYIRGKCLILLTLVEY